jgi:hypothetical protein
VIASGTPGVAPETRASERFFNIGSYIISILIFLPALFSAQQGEAWKNWGTAIGLFFIGLALALFMVGFIRRRCTRAAHLSLERVALELRADSLVVRDGALEISIPITEVSGFHAEIDRAKSRTRIWVSAPKHPIQSRGFSPLLVLRGELASQRAIKAEFERRLLVRRTQP